ncbi:(S)-coclaurine N-methyltransferase [Neolecta irregularis DAH-3]|uniref:(S)-coclaurine N-methyltransferase n=1 Tax=Neolecta irregularis (strain DAH-3) TaxID=1198029 RepID=A0A1U7LJE3_NEOID|nr:(S)-coclaurine N-methyltransferase [Neolecta irregularis DAH-3]|eukprot:OLL22767.1 (S)-coclaurine N-methyltransferase [Neolecta irregularis DAH-3]
MSVNDLRLDRSSRKHQDTSRAIKRQRRGIVYSNQETVFAVSFGVHYFTIVTLALASRLLKLSLENSSPPEEEQTKQLAPVKITNTNWYEHFLDNGWIPEIILRQGIRKEVQDRLNSIRNIPMCKLQEKKMRFIENLRHSDSSIDQEKANEQHYEVRTEFMKLCLGPRMKYSSCLYPTGNETLQQAEDAILESYVEKAGITDGMTLLDLGCGWGSMCLFLAEKFPGSQTYALSNSSTQKIHIDEQASKKELKNLTVITADCSWEWIKFSDLTSFDRVLSVEMFERMKNHKLLLARISSWLKPHGKLFVHIFCHKTTPYDYHEDGWIQKYFFTGGTMPSADLFLYFQEDMVIENHWLINGKHYAQTCEDWLKLLYKHKNQAIPHLRDTYGEGEAEKWYNRWIVFYLARAELFAWKDGEEWMVGQYLFTI